ncbi:MMPL family transporter [Georgenia faecalis]|uniref:MMPL family transporter n=1 Tax=Georgenia faecalis TaxID=2483799 RepID=A0ABV9D954_9MICO|nr:MMPL family transporter [Georgenia faecalis]
MSAVFDRLGRTVARHPRTTVLAWLALALVSVLLAGGLTGEGLFARLQTGEPAAPGSDSERGREILDEASSAGEEISLLVEGVDLADPAVVAEITTALQPVHGDLADLDGVAEVVSPFVLPGGLEHPAAGSLVAADQDGFLLSVTLEEDLPDAAAVHDAVVERLDEVPADLADMTGGDVEVLTSSPTLIADAIVGQVQEDLVRGEVVALPLALLLMVVVFGGFLAASMPLVGALASIAVGLGALLGFTYVMDIDSYMINVLTVVGLGLSVDYGLLVVSRYREELRHALAAEPAADDDDRRRRRAGRDEAVTAALGRTLATAGRTVTFSAVTIALAIAGMVFMTPELIRALSAAGVTIVVLSVLASITLVPALLSLIGRRLDRPSVLSRVPGLRRVVGGLGDVAPEEGVFSRIARFVHAYPWPVLLGVLAILVVLASPLRSFDMRSSGVELLPSESDQRDFITSLVEDYPAAEAPAVVVVVDGTEEEAAALAEEVAALDGVTAVGPPAPAGEYTTLGVRLSTDDPGGAEAAAVVSEIRDLDAEVETWVTGQSAIQKDFNDALVDGMPWVILFVAAAVLVLLFLMTGSVLIPIKALLTNALSLAASLGITVWIFVEGHLADVLGFEPVAGLEATVVPLIITFGFGLAMDYEVFLLARIKEFWDAGLPNDLAVERGLQLMGRIITSAAAIIIAVFAGFASGDLIVIKQVGLALAVTVLIDATLVRLLLVPATMTLLGKWNWWAPAPLARLYEKVKIVH